MAICHTEDRKPMRGKQSLGAAPNIVHSLDAAHLMLVTCRCPFPISTVHDSFGALAADMPELYRIVRETFVELYETDPLKHILNDIHVNYENIGTYDIHSILDSEYAFS